MRKEFKLKLLGRNPITAKSAGTIVSRAADVCLYVAWAKDVELRIFVRRVRAGSLEILYWLLHEAQTGNAVAQLAFDLIVADIIAAFGFMRLATGPDGSPRPLPGPAASAMSDVLQAVEDDKAIEGWSARANDSSGVRRTRDELFEMRGALGGPKEIRLRPKVHIEVQHQFPGFPRPSWLIKWAEGTVWETARVEAPVDGGVDVSRYDKLVVDLEIHELMSKGSAPAREVIIKHVHWSESA
jgi:hypothetical protein